MKRLITLLAMALVGYTGHAQCSTSVANSSTPVNTSNAYSTVQTFQTSCGGILRNVVVPNISIYSDDLRSSGAFITVRIKSAAGAVLATGPTTDQWYPGNTLTFDFGCSNLSLAASTTYQLEFLASFTTLVPLQLILFGRSGSSVYAGGSYIEDGSAPTANPNSDLYGWTVNLVNGNIAASSASATLAISAPCTSFYNATPELIASVQPTGAAMGSTTAKAYLQSSAPIYNGQPFVRRYYDITPATNASTATATVTLYFTQADFTDYNTNRGTLPALPNAAVSTTANTGNVRITQQHGTSATGAPGSFTGWSGTGPKYVLKTPSSVTWNSTASRWEVVLSVTGFSGFFAHSTSTNAPLPMDLVSFSAQLISNNNVLLNWSVANAEAVDRYTVERSADGAAFVPIEIVKASLASSYSFHDYQPLNGKNYYRLRLAANDDITYSNVHSIFTSEGAFVSVAPSPAHDYLRISTKATGLTGTLSDMQGRAQMQFSLSDGMSVNISLLPAGIYLLKMSNGEVLKVVKE